MNRRGQLWGAGSALAAVLAAAISTASAGGPPPAERPTCELDGRVLRIDPGHFDMRIVRAGERISARTSRGETCEDAAATVSAVNRVRVEGAEFTLDFDNGPFAPGFTDEGDGSSEIEFSVRPGLGELVLDLPTERQHVRAGRLAGGNSGVNLNAEEAQADVDLVIRGRPSIRRGFGLDLAAEDEADRLIASGGDAFTGPFPFRTVIRSRGGTDLIRGGRSDDLLIPGTGRDKVLAGRGDDFALIRDRRIDVARCGPGRDLMDADRKDRTRSCRRF